MRGALRDTPLKSITLEIFDRVAEISESGEFEAFMITEFVPHEKINAVPAGKTPYRRNLPGNACAVLHWSTNTPGIVEEAKRLTSDLASMVKIPGMSYGNYSKLDFTAKPPTTSTKRFLGPDSEALATAGAVSPIRTAELFRENYSRLQNIKRKYDPEMVFNKWFVITPA